MREGYAADRDKGTWRIAAKEARWNLTLDGEPRGKFFTMPAARSHAQDRENDVPITAQT
jgi:hypothetical protein